MRSAVVQRRGDLRTLLVVVVVAARVQGACYECHEGILKGMLQLKPCDCCISGWERSKRPGIHSIRHRRLKIQFQAHTTSHGPSQADPHKSSSNRSSLIHFKHRDTTTIERKQTSSYAATISTNKSPAETLSLTSTATRFTLPDTGAVATVSIFIADNTVNGVPALTS